MSVVPRLPTPEPSATVRSRTAWLLRALRGHAEDPALRVLRRFAAAYPGGVDPSTVSRWEAGKLPITYETLRAYEDLLGVRPRRLVAVVDTANRIESGAIGAPPLHRPAPLDDGRRQRRVLALVDRADSGAPMSSHHWDALTALLSGWPYPALRARDWELLTTRLATELYASEAQAWLRRQEAMLRLLGHRSGGRVAVATCASLVDDPASPLCGDVLLTLDGTRDRSANTVVLRQLRSPTSGDARHRAAIVSLQKLRSGHFMAADLTALVASTAELIDAPDLPTARIMAAELLQRAPSRLRPAERRHLRRAADVSVTNDGRLRGVRVPAALPTSDPELATLVDDLLRHPDRSHRFLAGQWLAVSPYGAPLGDQLSTDLRRPDVLRDGVSAPLYLEALTVLDAPAVRPLAEELFQAAWVAPAIRHTAVRALIHRADRSAPSFWRNATAHHRGVWRATRSTDTAAVLDQLVYAAGVTRDSPLLDGLAADGELPEAVRATARWWRRHPHLAPATLET